MTELEQKILRHRIAGFSEYHIAKTEGITVGEVKRILRNYAHGVLDDDCRRNHLALELARIDMLQQQYYAKAMNGDLQAAQFVSKLIERRCVMLGLHTPQMHTLQIIDNTTQRKSTTDRLEAAISALIEDKRGDGAKPH